MQIIMKVKIKIKVQMNVHQMKAQMKMQSATCNVMGGPLFENHDLAPVGVQDGGR